MRSAQQHAIDSMSEAQFQKAVVDMAEALQITVFHDTDSRRSHGAGLPDLILVGKDVVWVELKKQDGRLRDSQVDFMTKLQHAGQHVLLWRPEHLYDGAIERTLRRISPSRA